MFRVKCVDFVVYYSASETFVECAMYGVKCIVCTVQCAVYRAPYPPHILLQHTKRAELAYLQKQEDFTFISFQALI